jgi:signal transduction histidine kinase
VPDIEADYQVEEPFLREGGLRSVIAAPILSGDDVSGVLLLGYRLPRAVGPAEVQRLETMVRRMAQALHHARAMDSVRQNTAGLESQVAQQLAALQAATQEQAEARRQVQEAQRHSQELEQTLKRQAEAPPVIKEVIVEKEVVRERVVRAEVPGAGTELRAAMQRTVSQELRAPLSALLDLPRLLVEGLDKPLGDEERQQLEILRDHGTDVLELIDDLVILSGVEAGQIKIVKSSFDLPASIQRVVRILQPRAASKGNRIDTDIKLHVGQVVSDAKRVEQVLTNLLLNAIRYTEVGEIRVTCFVRDADVVLTVADDGAGFSTEEQTRIFEPFLQVGPRDGRAFPGTGLSLTVCQRLVEALGGKIRVESEVDRGTWFTVVLPVQS